ncbi:hypothetical protein E2C01_056183 [Portunus trituberculatus]|uniref:Uncharacterized protein n=1 Tax=Portunus trituberculatus TaxID=210409 RepID=A0A5B7GPN5_PORTR|nr:hypothetical protein [Portunus trituberculatus]
MAGVSLFSPGVRNGRRFVILMVRVSPVPLRCHLRGIFDEKQARSNTRQKVAVVVGCGQVQRAGWGAAGLCRRCGGPGRTVEAASRPLAPSIMHHLSVTRHPDTHKVQYYNACCLLLDRRLSTQKVREDLAVWRGVAFEISRDDRTKRSKTLDKILCRQRKGRAEWRTSEGRPAREEGPAREGQRERASVGGPARKGQQRRASEEEPARYCQQRKASKGVS